MHVHPTMLKSPLFKVFTASKRQLRQNQSSFIFIKLSNTAPLPNRYIHTIESHEVLVKFTEVCSDISSHTTASTAQKKSPFPSTSRKSNLTCYTIFSHDLINTIFVIY